MKTLIATLLITAAAQTAPAPARSSAVSPLLGSWAVDVSRMPTPPTERPKSATITFSDAGNGKWTTHVDIVYAVGSESHSVSHAALDGSAAPIKNSNEADTAALKLPAPNVLVMDLVRHGIPASTRVYTVAADGKTMVETASYVGSNGQPVMQTHYFTRIR